MAFTVKFEVTRETNLALEALAKVEKIVREEALRAINEASTQVRAKMTAATPVGGTGLTKAAWQVNPARAETKGEFTGGVSNSQIAALIIDEGARAGKQPPSRNLQQWVRRKLGISQPTLNKQVAFKIARTIKRRGIPSKRTFTKTFKGLESEIRTIMEAAQVRIARRLEGG